jgi:hypothetical protein
MSKAPALGPAFFFLSEADLVVQNSRRSPYSLQNLNAAEEACAVVTRSILAATALLVASADATAWESGLELFGGYRQDDLSWSIADPSGSPDVLSELSFDDLRIVQLGGELDLRTRRGFEAEIALRIGEILDGDNRDSDYDVSGQEYSRSENTVEDDDVWDGSVGIGWGIDWTDPRTGRSARFIPMVGYSVHQQNLRITDGNQTISESPSVQPLGPFDGLNSTYEAEWRGPWIGLHGLYEATPRWSAEIDVEFHWADFEAVADWNLRADLAHPKSFEQEAEGQGLRLLLKGVRRLGPRSDFTLRLALENWETDEGTDTIYLADGTAVTTRLNEVEWQSLAIEAGWRRRF